MLVPLQITFHGIAPSEALREAARKHVARLQAHAADVASCHVFIEPAGRHQRHGSGFVVRVQVALPGSEFASANSDQGNEDAYAALGAAFDAMRRQIDDFRARRRDVRRSTPAQD